MTLTNNNIIKRFIYSVISMIMVTCLCIMPTFAAGRKLVGKSASGAFTWAGYRFTYSFNATAGLSYNNSNNITSISDLSFSNIVCTSSSPAVTGSIIPKQTSKTYSGKTATYVVTLTRTAYGFYTDKVNYTFTYRTTDAGRPYSLDKDQLVLIDVVEGQPYDIQILQ